MVLADYSKPGEFPDGRVDWAFQFLSKSKERGRLDRAGKGLTAMYQYDRRPLHSREGSPWTTPQGLVQLMPNGRDVPKSDSSLLAVLTLSRSVRRRPHAAVSFAEAEALQLTDAARSSASGATVSTLMAPDGRDGQRERPPSPAEFEDRATLREKYVMSPRSIRTAARQAKRVGHRHSRAAARRQWHSHRRARAAQHSAARCRGDRSGQTVAVSSR